MDEDSSWSEIATALTQAALKVCGKRTRQIANPWTIGHEDELSQLHNSIASAVRDRNESLEQDRPLQDILRNRDNLRKARAKMKGKLKELEREWWDKILDECQQANIKGDMGTMYRTLRQLGGRDRKPDTGTTLTTDEFKAHFEGVSKNRYEISPQLLMDTVARMGDHRAEKKYIEENNLLNETPSDKEIQDCISEIRESAPGKDNVRIKYIKLASPYVKSAIVAMVKKMFLFRAPTWDEILKNGQIVPLHKKGGKK